MATEPHAALTAASSLTRAELRELASLEATVERGLETFVEVALALREIRDRRLYRESHPSFASYVRERFALGRRTAYGYLEAAGVLANVPPEAQLTVSHLRALAPLPAAAQHELAPAISEMTVAQARQVIRSWREQNRRTLSIAEPPPLPEGTFSTIVADPPWRFEHDWGDGLAADAYATMTREEIAALDVPALAAPDCHLYLWAPVAKVPDALEVCSAWGFRYVGLLTWVKRGLGLGTWWRVSTEHIVFGVRGSLRTAPNLRNWFEAARTRHSAKPEAFYELVEQASPAPYLDLFARGERPGWQVWGNEVAGGEIVAAKSSSDLLGEPREAPPCSL
ncbi:MAG: hypothetical protein H0V84_01400 [Actinobacteria bacterium]|nr:hypothetical protein [Actinomycetota bacterium]